LFFGPRLASISVTTLAVMMTTDPCQWPLDSAYRPCQKSPPAVRATAETFRVLAPTAAGIVSRIFRTFPFTFSARGRQQSPQTS
jgi:hypothetical protein